MQKIGILVYMFILVGAVQCTRSDRVRVTSDRDSISSSDYRRLVVGTWEGRMGRNDDNHLVMYVTFTGDDLIVDYSPAGGAKFSAPYKFIDDRIIETDRYPERLVVQPTSDNEISFKPPDAKLRPDIELIYVCSFKRVVK